MCLSNINVLLLCNINRETTKEEDAVEPVIVPTLRPSGPARSTLAIR